MPAPMTRAAATPPMTADHIRDALYGRWPAAEYVSIDEAPQTPDRSQGRRLDRLVIGLHRSRGLELDGVEVKVSLGDWRRELADVGKAAWWWERVHRFWVAVPADLAGRVRETLPSGWGLLACTVGRVRVAVKPAKRTPAPLGWETVVGLLRVASGAGANALARAHEMGYGEGLKRGEGGAGADGAYEALRAQHTRLQERVKAFEEASGVTIDQWDLDAVRKAGRLVQLLDWDAHPDEVARKIGRAITAGESMTAAMRQFADALDSVRNGARP